MDQPDPAEAVRMLDLMLAFFGDGEGWTRGTLNDGRGGRCLLGALQYIESEYRVSGASASFCLRAAIRRTPQTPKIALLSGYRIIPDGCLFAALNDSCGNLAELRAVIADARARAQADLSCHASREAIAT
jgi:hypothetical protein